VDVEKEDSGKYTCEAKNEQGSFSTSAFLQVDSKWSTTTHLVPKFCFNSNYYDCIVVSSNLQQKLKKIDFWK